MEVIMLQSINLNWAWKNFTEHKINLKSTPILVSFAAGCMFQFVTMSAISCYIESDRLMYAGIIGIAFPITAVALSYVLRDSKKEDGNSPRRKTSAEKIKGKSS
jgi:hypothetical protein